MAVGLALTATLVVLHITFVRHVGGLWRDEVQIVNLGNMPTLAEMWDKNEHDSFPIAWHLLIRLWTKLGLGQTDFSLRCLGLLMGLGIVAVLWWVVRQFHGSAPLVSLTLCALSPTVIWFGDSMRGYGLGTLTMLFLFGAFWRMVESPTRGAPGWRSSPRCSPCSRCTSTPCCCLPWGPAERPSRFGGATGNCWL